MTSQISREDLDAAAFTAGIKDPLKRKAFLRTVDLYAYAQARKMAGLEAMEELRITEEKYLCRGCGEYKITAEFPEGKRGNPGRPVNCLACQVGKTYRCKICHEPKTLAGFPEKKTLNPRSPSACLVCEPGDITRNDAGYNDQPRKRRKKDHDLPVLPGGGETASSGTGEGASREMQGEHVV